ncbi:hypothetical protein DM02DRAFT_646105 [Periconia macrospinosa]|uniref:Nephrocystin 3-like N-terminal domain-containing protein n=1 Tax=Periconia macrospinosa TaxID=97972 RepID=A0A2V1D7W6_9PLEO|nr:hypothetical protein DM02DRAFT_646105 [Periconia macrospinosa]
MHGQKNVEMIMVDPWADRALFDDAIATVQSAISEEHRKTFLRYADAADLLEGLKVHCCRNAKDCRKLNVCIEKMLLFTDKFAPYLELLGAYVKTSLDLGGWLWGMVGLVLNIGSSYNIVLESIVDTFVSISAALPDYQRLHNQHNHKLHLDNDERWCILLSYAYADMMQHCLDLYHIFCRDIPGEPLDSRLARLEARIVCHRRWIEAEFTCQSEDVATKELQRRQYTEFLSQQADADSHSSTLERLRMAKRMRRIDKIKAWLSNDCAYQDVYEHRMRQRHPNTCSWFLETAEYCSWKNLSFDQTVTDDIDALERTWHDRILFVQAKPGFGKSFISGAVIDDLVDEAENLDIDDEHEPPSTAFFHFNAAHSYCTQPSDAFRALANQLVHTHRHSRITLDTVSLLMRKTLSHVQASPDDVTEVLSLLLRQHPTFLVIDGVDECVDVGFFLNTLHEICCKSDTRVIIFSRPNIKVEMEPTIDLSRVFSLADGMNGADIQSFVSENLHGMADKGFFGINMDRSLIPQVAERSNGVFLWASLVVKYLQSPDLSPDQRRFVLEQIHQLEGLESIYRHILELLDLRPDREKQIISNVLRWLSLSINRLCMPGFRIATAVVSGQSMTDPDAISAFYDSLPQLTCGLVEVTDCSAVFAHRSVKEYLQSLESQTSPFNLHNETEAHKHLAARCLSFLAYDIPKRRPTKKPRPPPLPSSPPSSYVGPSSSSGTSKTTARSDDSGYRSNTSLSPPSNASSLFPLSSSTSTPRSALPSPALTPTPTYPLSSPSPHHHPFDANTPFLRYSSLCWPIHLTRALSSPPSPSPSSSPSPPPTLPFLAPLSAFLTNPIAVTSWVEASWHFHLPPNLSRLIPLLEALKASVPPASLQGRQLRWVLYRGGVWDGVGKEA